MLRVGMSPAHFHDDMDRRRKENPADVLGNLRRRLSDRLRPVCGDIPSAEFDALVVQMADIEVKYAKREEQEIMSVFEGGQSEPGVVNNVERHQFERRDGEYLSRLKYRIDGNVLDLLHTEVPPELKGRGIANQLAQTALSWAGEREMLVRPTCPFVQAYLKRHPMPSPRLTSRRDD